MTPNEFVITINPHFTMSKATLYRKVKSWLEHNGHTTADYGFELEEIRHKGDDQ